jgi:Tfp pilus assembly protein PilF
MSKVSPELPSRALTGPGHARRSVCVPAALASHDTADRRPFFLRDANDWLALAGCFLKLNQPSKGIQALEKAVQIQPYRADLHAQLSYVYSQLGNRKLADEHLRKAQWLAAHSKE